ncbi:hypothetical protein MBLL_03421 [Methylobacterium bullatum]|uniref:Uncharacterized protein n=1 Tax=Methylobacterium bullatum TaxID=570505 RepID=A0A679KHL9_9HYPH|nr:hypothetical protein MBLL_03421 [Methylobacterium bullatum]
MSSPENSGVAVAAEFSAVAFQWLSRSVAAPPFWGPAICAPQIGGTHRLVHPARGFNRMGCQPLSQSGSRRIGRKPSKRSTTGGQSKFGSSYLAWKETSGRSAIRPVQNCVGRTSLGELQSRCDLLTAERRTTGRPAGAGRAAGECAADVHVGRAAGNGRRARIAGNGVGWTATRTARPWDWARLHGWCHHAGVARTSGRSQLLGEGRRGQQDGQRGRESELREGHGSARPAEFDQQRTADRKVRRPFDLTANESRPRAET